MALSPIMRPLGLAIAFLGLVQSIAWLVMALLSILQYADAIDMAEEISTHNSLLLASIKALYFMDTPYLDVIISKYVFFGFSVGYFILSLVWFANSSALYFFINFKKWEPARILLISHFVVVGVICTVDVIFMALLAKDYDYILNMYNATLSSKETNAILMVYFVMAVGIMMTIAARGFVLWFLNFLSGIYSVCFIMQYQDNDRNILYNIPIDAYQEYPGDLNYAEAIREDDIQQAETVPASYTNGGFTQDAYSITQPYGNVRPTSEDSLPNNNYFDYNRRDPARNEQTLYAKPNKVMKTPGPMVPPKPSKKEPPIPFPDYTPPQSPKQLRSVIKQNSSYY